MQILNERSKAGHFFLTSELTTLLCPHNVKDLQFIGMSMSSARTYCIKAMEQSQTPMGGSRDYSHSKVHRKIWSHDAESCGEFIRGMRWSRKSPLTG